MKIYFRSFYFISIIASTLAISHSACSVKQSENIQSEIDSIIASQIVDKREALCTIFTETSKDKTIILKGETTVGDLKNIITSALDKKGIVFTDSILVLPDTTSEKNYHGLVYLSVANIRKDPGHRSELVSQAIFGTPVLILKKKDGWFLIQTPDKYYGWTESSSVKSLSTDEFNKWRRSDRIIFLSPSGWIYSTSTGNGIVSDIVGGSILSRGEEVSGYVKVFTPDGREGFVKKELTADFAKWKTSVQCTPESLLKSASELMGVPYLWGGRSSKGVDCSGFVQNTFFLNGLILSRDASLQALNGHTLDTRGGFSSMQNGDLLFFGSKNVTHVAIYCGDGEYIHSSGRVQLNSLDSLKSNYSDYRKKLLLSGSRIIGSEGTNGIARVADHSWY